ncbi:transglycosylase domain-containing protein [Cellulomonas rhizosphaerae]|uniref:transglycosylase domain-containing protein n=1 Tax=Cellulomonas rhizosphaerae TaxID=2293719 RepID=UPI001F3AE661|nr:transglycosylase domain-containing protein [Cellulomonas rhizosphaerae]
MAGSSNPRSAPPRARRGSSRGTRAAAPARGKNAQGKKRVFDYPRTGYHGLHRWLPSWRVVLGTILGAGFLGLGAIVAAYATIDIPATGGQDTSAQTSTVYYANNADGSRGPVMGTYAVQKRTIVDYDTLPEYVGQAVAAGEDRSFFESKAGISVTGMARAFFHNATASDGTTQGGSTLTQQYVERYYVDKTTTDYVGKAREALMAIKIAQTESKEEILGRYLNTIYFGRDSYGVQAASQAYFGVDAKDLTISQAALLAAVIPSPNNWDPAVDAAKSEQRWDIILDAMQEEGWVTPAARADLTFPETIDYKRSELYRGTQGYLLTTVEKELAAGPLELSKDELMRGGYTIITTIKKPVQKDMNATASDFYKGKLIESASKKDSTPDKRTKVAMASIDPATGAIVAMYGGQDFIDDQINRATVDAIQAGSTFKPFTLIAGLENGKTLNTRYAGYTPQTFPEWENGTKKVRNFGDEQFGYIDLVTATAQSVNTVYAQLNIDVGADKTVDVADRAGITTTIPDVVSNVLGTATVHPLDMASAYATIAAGGVHHDPYIVASVLNSTGSTALTGGSEGKRVFDKDVIADTTYAMTQVVEQGSGKNWIKPLGRPIAGKTGTTQDNRAAWFVGFTPQLATSVAMSQVGPDGKAQVTITPKGYKFGTSIPLDAVTGATMPAQIWSTAMGKVFELADYKKVEQFPERANVGPKPTAKPTKSPTATPTPTQTQTEAPTTAVVPDGLVGKLQADATSALYAVGLVPVIESAYSDTVVVGRVISASPGSGKKVDAGASVTLVISSGPKPAPTQTPKPTQTPAPTKTAPPKPTESPDPQPTEDSAGG